AWFGLPDEKVAVVTEGPDAVFGPRPEGAESAAALRRSGVEPGSRYLLYVGGLSPHKNLPRLVEAFARGAPADVGLVLVGDPTDVAAMAEALRRLCDDPAHRERLAAVALRRAARFTWSEAARALLATFDGFEPAWNARAPDLVRHAGHPPRRIRREEIRRKG